MGLPLRLPSDAHHTLYVEGVPADASEREMAHIFRPFPGYISLRLRAKGGRNGGLSGPSFSGDAICFVEFESAYHVRFVICLGRIHGPCVGLVVRPDLNGVSLLRELKTYEHS